MSDLKQSLFTRVLNPIKDNKYFNSKDASFLAMTAAGAGAGYALSDGNKEQSINGGIFGAAGGLLYRQGFEGFAKGSSKAFRNFGKVSDNITKVKGGIIDNETGISHILPFGLNNIADMKTSKEAMLYGVGMTGVGAITGAIGGWAGERAGLGTTVTGGLIEGAALGIFLPAMLSKTALNGGGVARQAGNAAIGKATAVAGMFIGGYDGFEGEDGSFSKAMLRGALYGKLGQSAGMLGMERYGKGFYDKIADGKLGRIMGRVKKDT